MLSSFYFAKEAVGFILEIVEACKRFLEADDRNAFQGHSSNEVLLKSKIYNASTSK